MLIVGIGGCIRVRSVELVAVIRSSITAINNETRYFWGRHRFRHRLERKRILIIENSPSPEFSDFITKLGFTKKINSGVIPKKKKKNYHPSNMGVGGLLYYYVYRILPISNSTQSLIRSKNDG